MNLEPLVFEDEDSLSLPPLDFDEPESGEAAFEPLAKVASKETGLPVSLLKAVAEHESGFNPKARPEGTSAYGYMQLIDGTAEEVGVDKYDPQQNVLGGAKYLKQQIDKFGSVELGLTAYFKGPGKAMQYGLDVPGEEGGTTAKNYRESILKKQAKFEKKELENLPELTFDEPEVLEPAKKLPVTAHSGGFIPEGLVNAPAEPPMAVPPAPGSPLSFEKAATVEVPVGSTAAVTQPERKPEEKVPFEVTSAGPGGAPPIALEQQAKKPGFVKALIQSFSDIREDVARTELFDIEQKGTFRQLDPDSKVAQEIIKERKKKLKAAISGLEKDTELKKKIEESAGGDLLPKNVKDVPRWVNTWGTIIGQQIPIWMTGPVGIAKVEEASFIKRGQELGIPDEIINEYKGPFAGLSGAIETSQQMLAFGPFKKKADKIPGVKKGKTAIIKKALKEIGIAGIEGLEEVGQAELMHIMLGRAAKQAGFTPEEIQKKIPRENLKRAFAIGFTVGGIVRGAGTVAATAAPEVKAAGAELPPLDFEDAPATTGVVAEAEALEIAPFEGVAEQIKAKSQQRKEDVEAGLFFQEEENKVLANRLQKEFEGTGQEVNTINVRNFWKDLTGEKLNTEGSRDLIKNIWGRTPETIAQETERSKEDAVKDSHRELQEKFEETGLEITKNNAKTLWQDLTGEQLNKEGAGKLIKDIWGKSPATLAQERARAKEAEVTEERPGEAEVAEEVTAPAVQEKIVHAYTASLKEDQVDAVTEIANSNTIRKEMRKAVDEDKYIAMVDVDDFKPINEVWTHQEGDDVLKSVGIELRQYFPDDMVGRYGGDEFAVIFKGVPDPAKMEAFQKASADEIKVAGQPVTLSVGIAKGKKGSGLYADVLEGEAKKSKNRLIMDIDGKKIYVEGRVIEPGEKAYVGRYDIKAAIKNQERILEESKTLAPEDRIALERSIQTLKRQDVGDVPGKTDQVKEKPTRKIIPLKPKTPPKKKAPQKKKVVEEKLYPYKVGSLKDETAVRSALLASGKREKTLTDKFVRDWIRAKKPLPAPRKKRIGLNLEAQAVRRAAKKIIQDNAIWRDVQISEQNLVHAKDLGDEFGEFRMSLTDMVVQEVTDKEVIVNFKKDPLSKGNEIRFDKDDRVYVDAPGATFVEEKIAFQQESELTPEEKSAQERDEQEFQAEARTVEQGGFVDLSKDPEGVSKIEAVTKGLANFEIPSETRTDLLRRKLQDKFLPLKRTQESPGVKVTPDTDAYLSEELMSGKTQSELETAHERLVKPLQKDVLRTKADYNALEWYAYAKHAPERNAQVGKINKKFRNEIAETGQILTDYDLETGSGMSNEQAAEIVAEVKKKGLEKKYDRLVKQIYAINQESLRLKVEYGLMSQKDAQTIADTYKYYTPLKGTREVDKKKDKATTARTGKGFDIRGPESKRALGRRSKASNIIANSVLNLQETIVRGEKNKVAQDFLQLVKDNPNPDLWTIDEIKLARYFDRNKGEVVERIDPRAKLADNVLGVKVNGKQHFITIKNPALASAMKNLGADKAGKIVQTMGTVNRYLASVSTRYNPPFIITNLARDVQAMFINVSSEHSFKMATKILKDVPAAMKGAYLAERGNTKSEWAKEFEEMSKEGGRISFFGLENVDILQKKLMKDIAAMKPGMKGRTTRMFRGVAKFVEDTNSAVENASRLASYKNFKEKFIKEGMDEKQAKRQAASMAKNVTVNFNRKGEYGQMMNALFVFSTATVSGTAKLFKVLNSSRGRKIMGSLIIGRFLLAEMNRLLGGEDDDGEDYYDKIPDWEKANFLILMKPDTNGEYFKFMLPYGYNIFSALGVGLSNAIHHPEKIMNSAAMVAGTMANSFNPLGTSATVTQTLVPTQFRWLADLNLNKNFFGAPIVKEEKFGPKKAKSETYFKSTSEISKNVAKAFNEVSGGTKYRPGWGDFSPEVMDYVFEYLGGGAGKTFTRTVDIAAKLGTNQPVPIREIPFVRKLVGEVHEYHDIQKMYENMDNLDAIENDYKDLQETDRKEAFKLKKENRGAFRLISRKIGSKTKKELKELRIKREKAQERGRQKRVEFYTARIERIVDRFNKEYKRVID